MVTAALTPFALVFMLLSMGTVTLLAGYCLYRVLRSEKPSQAGVAPRRSEPASG